MKVVPAESPRGPAAVDVDDVARREADLDRARGAQRARPDAAARTLGPRASDVATEAQGLVLGADDREGERLVKLADVALAVDVGLGAQRHGSPGGLRGGQHARRRLLGRDPPRRAARCQLAAASPCARLSTGAT